jgi:hypothetical protein
VIASVDFAVEAIREVGTIVLIDTEGYGAGAFRLALERSAAFRLKSKLRLLDDMR